MFVCVCILSRADKGALLVISGRIYQSKIHETNRKNGEKKRQRDRDEVRLRDRERNREIRDECICVNEIKTLTSGVSPSLYHKDFSA